MYVSESPAQGKGMIAELGCKDKTETDGLAKGEPGSNTLTIPH